MLKLSRANVLGLKDVLGNFAFILPAVAIFCVFYIYPFYKIFQLSLTDWDGISPFLNFVRFENFIDLLHDKVWWSSMWHALYITLFALLLQNPLAFALALACDQEISLKGFYRVVFFIPPVLSEIVVGLIWTWLLYAGMQGGEYIGLLNHFLTQIGLEQWTNDWLSDPNTALTCIAVVHCWKGFGWGFIMLLAGLQTIDKQLYEAAKVDGASAWTTFLHVTIPNMLPVIVVVIILTILGSMQVFILVMAMTGQGLVHHTEVPVTWILGAMRKQEFGYACAMGVNFGLILITISFALNQISKRMKQV